MTLRACAPAVLAALLLLSGQPTVVVAQDLRTWYLAEGATGSFFDEDILIANPHAVAADVTITYLTPSSPPIVQAFSVAPTSRQTVRVKDVPGLANTAVSAVVSSTVEIVVERTMFWANAFAYAAHSSPGVLAPSTSWFLAEGSTGFFDQFVLLANSDPSADAEVTVTFLKEDGSTIEQTRTVAANSRQTIWVNQDVPGLASAPFSTVVESTNGVAIIVERAMYWGAGWEGGHGSPGVTAPALQWRFAEGFTGTGFNGAVSFDTYLLLANPSPTAANVRVTYFREVGVPIERFYTVGPTSRLNIFADGIPGLEAAAFSAVVDSMNGVPVVAERAMYWGPDGVWLDGHNSPGLTAEAAKWGFADGTDEDSFETFLLVVNSSPQDLPIHVTFMREDGRGITKDFVVGPESRFTLAPSEYTELQGRRFSTFIESTDGALFAAERAIYRGNGFEAGHGTTGTPWTGVIATPPPVAPPLTITTTDSSLAFGDSITAGVTARPVSIGTASFTYRAFTTGYPERLEALLLSKYPSQAISVQNAGVPGERAFIEGQARFPGTLSPQHDLVIILEGVNDTNGGISNPQIVNALRNMVRAAKNAGKQVILSTLTPVYASSSGIFKADPVTVADLNLRIRNLAVAERVLLVDIHAAFGSNMSLISSDGLHPSPSGYQRMAQEFFDAIVANFQTTTNP